MRCTAKLSTPDTVKRPVGGAAARQQHPRERDPKDPGGEVDQEDQLPAAEREQQPADRGAEREPDGLRGALHAEAAGEQSGGQALDDQRDRVGLQHRRPEPLQHARGDQPAGRGRQPAQHRAEREDGEAVGVEQLAPEAVGEQPDGDERAGEHQHVGERHPPHRARGLAEAGADAGQGERHDRGVELAHEGSDAHSPDDEGAGAGAFANPRGACGLAQQPRPRREGCV